MIDVSALDLLRQCEEAHARGCDFPTIWRTVLKHHPLVIGLPGHEIQGGEALIVVRLLTGQKLSSSTRGFQIQ